MEANYYQERLWRLLLVLVVFLGFIELSLADVGPPNFIGQDKDPEQILGSTFERIFDFVLYFAMGVGTIGVVSGLVMTVPVVGQKERGFDWIKTSLIVVVAAGVIKLIIALFAFASR